MKILFFDQELTLAPLLKKGFTEHGHDIEVAYDWLATLQLASENQYDLIILDILFSGEKIMEICKITRGKNPDISILVLTDRSSPESITAMYDAGMDDYIVKPFKFEDLFVRAIALTRKKSKNAAGNVFQVFNLEVNTHTKIVKRQGAIIHLTAREYSLMVFFVKNPGRILSRSELAEKVWGTSFNNTTNFVDVYVKYLRNKIDKNYSPKLIHTVFGRGYMLSVSLPQN